MINSRNVHKFRSQIKLLENNCVWIEPEKRTLMFALSVRSHVDGVWTGLPLCSPSARWSTQSNPRARPPSERNIIVSGSMMINKRFTFFGKRPVNRSREIYGRSRKGVSPRIYSTFTYSEDQSHGRLHYSGGVIASILRSPVCPACSLIGHFNYHISSNF